MEIVEARTKMIIAHKIKSVLTQQQIYQLHKEFSFFAEEVTFLGEEGYAYFLPLGYVAMSPTILRCGVRVSLHPFFCNVLNYFSITLMQLVPNNWHILVV